MSEIKEIREKLLEKYGDVSNIDEIIELYDLLKKYGHSIVREIYPKTLFNKHFNTLSQEGFIETNSQDKIINIKNDILLVNENFKKITSINMEWIRYFVVFAELGSTTEACNKLNISRPALIKSISGIEDYLQVPLVERKKHFKGLTFAGKLFLEKAREILQNINNIEKYFSDFNCKPNRSILHIACSNPWSSMNLLPKIMGNFMKNNPGIYPKFYTMVKNDIEKWIASGEIEIGLLGFRPKRQELDYIEGKKIPYIIVGKPQKMKKYDEFDYIVPSVFSLEKDISQIDFLIDEKFKRKIIAETDSLQMALNLCEEGVGVAFVPEIIALERIKSGRLAIVAEPPVAHHTQLFIVWNKKIHINKIMRELIFEIKKISQD